MYKSAIIETPGCEAAEQNKRDIHSLGSKGSLLITQIQKQYKFYTFYPYTKKGQQPRVHIRVTS